MGGFFKRLFGGGKPEPEPQPPAPADPLAQDRHNAALYDRREDPLAWAHAQQILANNLIAVTANEPPPRARAMLREAAELLAKALEAAGPGAATDFRASLLRMQGEATWRRAQLLDGNEKGRALADAANILADAVTLCPPELNHDLWLVAQMFRGASLMDLGDLTPDDEAGLAWLDEAAACFDDIAHNGARAPNTVHPVAAYNRIIVMEKRAQRSPEGTRRTHYQEARRSALEALSDRDFAASQTDLPAILARLDEALAKDS